MSLQVWLPLNGDLQNKGLANIRIVSNTATFKNNGKTGNKCLNLHTCNRFYCQKLANKKEFSFAFWYKPETSESTVNWNDVIYFYDKNEDESVDGNLRLQTSYNNSYILSVHANASYNMIPDSGGTYGSNCLLSSSTATRDKWYHVVITLSEDKGLNAYINGELKWIVAHNGGHITGYFNLGQISVSGNEEGSMNDLRIYDHCLSLKQIKELSKGLVLHYSLDNNGLGKINSNLLLNSSLKQNLTNWYFSGKTDSDGITIKDGYSCTHIQGALQTTKYLNPRFTVLSNSDFNFKPYAGLKLTLSADVLLENVVKGTTNYWLALYKSGTSINGTWTAPTSIKTSSYLRSDGLCEPNLLNEKGWVHVYHSFYFSENYDWDSGKNIAPIFYARDFTGDFYIKDAKLEFDYQNTPWIPNTNDPEYSTLGYDDNIIYDCSGYQNNGILTDLTYSTDTLKYNASANFDGNTSVISLGNISSLLQKQFTINLWFKKSELGSKNYETLFGGPSGFEMDTRAGSSTTLSLYMASTRGGNVFSSFNLNQWYMVTMINDGTNELYYINGELKKTIAKKSMPSGNYFIGAWSTAIKQNYKGLISDFRIYVTALSEDDIKELYSVRASGDRNSNYFSSGKFIEQNNLSRIQHNGINNYNSYIEFNSINSNIMPNSVNMALGSANVSTGTWRNAGTSNMSRSRVLITDSPIGKCYGFQNSGIQTANDGSCYGIDSFPLQANTQYTISMWARITEGTEGYAGFNVYSLSSQNGGSHNGTIMKNYRVTALNSNKEWTKCWYTFTTNSSTTRNIYIGITTGETSVTTQMCAIKIEKGSIVTSWKPKEEDENYNQYFTNRININRQKNIFSNSFIEN